MWKANSAIARSSASPVSATPEYEAGRCIVIGKLFRIVTERKLATRARRPKRNKTNQRAKSISHPKINEAIDASPPVWPNKNNRTIIIKIYTIVAAHALLNNNRSRKSMNARIRLIIMEVTVKSITLETMAWAPEYMKIDDKGLI